MELGFTPVKGAVYLQDLTQDASSIYGTYVSTITPYIAGGNRLKTVFVHTHMDQSLLLRSDIETYIQYLRSYNYTVMPLSQCLGIPPYITNITQPQLGFSATSTVKVSVLSLLIINVIQLL